jgi:hypothetical protein
MKRVYTCNVCNYTTSILYCYQKHLNSIKHAKKNNNIGANIKAYKCEYCNKLYKNRSNKARHSKLCLITYNNMMQKIDLEKKEKQQKEKELIKSIIKEFTEDISAKISNTSNTTNITNNIINNNNKCINFSYIKKNFKNPVSLEECLASPLTAIEKYNITKSTPTVGCEYIIKNRCVNGFDIDKRPIHTIDIARNRFAVYCGEEPNKAWVSKEGKYITSKFIPLIISEYNERYKNTEGYEFLTLAKELHDMQTTGRRKIEKSIGEMTYVKNYVPPVTQLAILTGSQISGFATKDQQVAPLTPLTQLTNDNHTDNESSNSDSDFDDEQIYNMIKQIKRTKLDKTKIDSIMNIIEDNDYFNEF